MCLRMVVWIPQVLYSNWNIHSNLIFFDSMHAGHHDHNKMYVLMLAGLTNAFAKGAKLNGAGVFEDCPVSSINVNSARAIQSVSVGNSKVT